MFLVIQHLQEVCPLSWRATFEPVSLSLQQSIRFFLPPLPTHLSACLAARFPRDSWRWLGLPCSANFTRWVSVCLFAEGVIGRVGRLRNIPSIPFTFWSRPASIFGLSNITTFSGSSHMLRIPPFLAPIRFDAARVEFASRLPLPVSRLRASLSPGLHTMPLPAMHAGIENCRRHGRLSQNSAVKEAIFRSRPQNVIDNNYGLPSDEGRQ